MLNHEEEQQVSFKCVKQEIYKDANYIDFNKSIAQICTNQKISFYTLTESSSKETKITHTKSINFEESSIQEVGKVKLFSVEKPFPDNFAIIGCKDTPSIIEIWNLTENAVTCDFLEAHQFSITDLQII